MTTREKIIVGVMCLTIIYGAYELMGARTPRKVADHPQTNPMQDLRNFVTDITQNMLKTKLGSQYQQIIAGAGQQWTRDPLLPSTVPLQSKLDVEIPKKRAAIQAGSAADQYSYSGYLVMGTTKYAVINGTEYAIGESIGTDGFYLQSASSETAVLGRVNSSETIRLLLMEMY
jgi:hypothetical protein